MGIIPMKLIPANKQTTFEKRLPINVIHLENYRHQNRNPVPYTNEEREKLSESGLDPGRTNLYIKKKKKRREGRTQKKKKRHRLANLVTILDMGSDSREQRG